MIRSFALALATMAPPLAACAQTPQAASALHGEQATAQEQELIELSRQKWLWMADRNIEELEHFHWIVSRKGIPVWAEC